jgi:MraZ protein
MFTGEFHHSIDVKGRLILPSKFRDVLDAPFIITRGLDGCLFVYQQDEWEGIVSKLKELPFTQKKAREFNRFFLSGATECSIDKQGRVNIATPLQQYAGLEKECVVIGVNDRIEIWAKDKWDSFMETNVDDFSEMAEGLFDF